jgi:hypothetical protein
MVAFEDFIAMFAEPDAWIFAAMIGVAYCAGWLTGDACGFNRGVKSMVTFVASLNRRQAPPRAESGRPTARNHILPICNVAISDDRGEGRG